MTSFILFRCHRPTLVPRFYKQICLHRGYGFRVGDKETLTKAFTKHDVETFAEISLDKNPVHLDEEYAKTTKFGKCIVHGVLVHGLISAVCSSKLPGPGAIYLSQKMDFVSPAYVGEKITAEVEVQDIQRVVMTLSTVAIATDRQQVVMKGEAKIMLPRNKRRKQEDS